MTSGRTRRRRRRGRFAGVYKIISTLLVLAAVTVACMVFFRVQTIAVTGAAHYTDAQIIEASGVAVGGNLITISRARTAQSILRQLPYIDTVAINRQLPDALVITVTDCIPAYRMAAEDGGWWILDANGKILEQRTSAGGFALITGLSPLVPAPGTRLVVREEERDKLSALGELTKALQQHGLTDQVDSIDLSGDYLMTMIFDTRFTVQIPLVTDFDNRIRGFSAALQNEAVQEDKEYRVDMSVDGEMRFIPK